MGFRRKFEFGLAWRTLFLIGAVWLFTTSLAFPDLRAGRLVAALIVFLAVAAIWSFIRRTNLLVARFVDSVRFEDYAQRFSEPSSGGFDILGDTFDAALKALQARHIRESAEARYLSAIVDDAPSSLLTIDQSGKVELLNKAARALFARSQLTRIEDLDNLGPELGAAITLPSGTRKITRLVLEGVPQRAVFASAHITRLDKPITIISLLPVQSELGALEVAAQADLVRVLTHEIMNSLTPVTSLARSGAEMVAAAEDPSGQLSDAKVATDTVARRAEGILRFVESYREFAHTPDVRRRRFKARRWAEDMLQLARTAAGTRTIELQLEVRPPSLSIDADPELLGQAILNILRNAVRATDDVERPRVFLSICRNAQGNCQIDIRDNGHGIPESRREDIFLPFYTTHKGGSGVGLSFARQVTLAHGGSISALTAPEGGADIRIII